MSRSMYCTASVNGPDDGAGVGAGVGVGVGGGGVAVGETGDLEQAGAITSTVIRSRRFIIYLFHSRGGGPERPFTMLFRR